MRAMVLSECKAIETNPLKLTEIERHEIKRPNEILLKIEACGVCHSQLHGIEGDWQDIGIPPQLPTVPGHEVVGKVVQIGENVTKFKVGDRAGITLIMYWGLFAILLLGLGSLHKYRQMKRKEKISL